MTSSELNRRQLLVVALAAAGSALVGGAWWLARGPRVDWRRAAQRWLDGPDLDAAIRVGEAYLALLPSVDGDALWRAVEDRLAPWPQSGLGDAAFRRRVREAVESDFAREAVVRVEGYFFDQTTALLCALMALSARATAPNPTRP